MKHCLIKGIQHVPIFFEEPSHYTVCNVVCCHLTTTPIKLSNPDNVITLDRVLLSQIRGASRSLGLAGKRLRINCICWKNCSTSSNVLCQAFFSNDLQLSYLQSSNGETTFDSFNLYGPFSLKKLNLSNHFDRQNPFTLRYKNSKTPTIPALMKECHINDVNPKEPTGHSLITLCYDVPDFQSYIFHFLNIINSGVGYRTCCSTFYPVDSTFEDIVMKNCHFGSFGTISGAKFMKCWSDIVIPGFIQTETQEYSLQVEDICGVYSLYYEMRRAQRLFSIEILMVL